MVTVHTWYCESKKGGEHAFCILRSPFKNSIKKKVMFLVENAGHTERLSFNNWTLTKMTPENALEWLKSYEADTLYVSWGKVN